MSNLHDEIADTLETILDNDEFFNYKVLDIVYKSIRDDLDPSNAPLSAEGYAQAIQHDGEWSIASNIQSTVWDFLLATFAPNPLRDPGHGIMSSLISGEVVRKVAHHLLPATEDYEEWVSNNQE